MRIGVTLVVAMTILSAGAYAQTPSGEKIVKQGNGNGATACSSCHGADGGGNGAAGYPRLSSLNAGYIATQLQAYRDGDRSNAIMQPIAKALSKAESEAVAEYFAKQTAKTAPEKPDNAQTLQRGETLASRGDWDHTIPACMSCHGPGGNGVGETFPALAGQHASYIKAQIQAWQQGQRTGDPNELMQSIAKRLSPAQTEAVAAYFASLKPGN